MQRRWPEASVKHGPQMLTEATSGVWRCPWKAQIMLVCGRLRNKNPLEYTLSARDAPKRLSWRLRRPMHVGREGMFFPHLLLSTLLRGLKLLQQTLPFLGCKQHLRLD
eukprot:2247533-Pleurochrysis_carterae.AAC.1